MTDAPARGPFQAYLLALVCGALLTQVFVMLQGHVALLQPFSYGQMGAWAFFLNGTVTALLIGLLVAIPLGALLQHQAMRVAGIVVATGTLLFILLSIEVKLELGFHWITVWITVTDALQLVVLFLAGAWLGSRLRIPRVGPVRFPPAHHVTAGLLLLFPVMLAGSVLLTFLFLLTKEDWPASWWLAVLSLACAFLAGAYLCNLARSPRGALILLALSIALAVASFALNDPNLALFVALPVVWGWLALRDAQVAARQVEAPKV
jgi:hypothetical protein